MIGFTTADAFDSLVYSSPNQQTLNYLKNKASVISDTLTEQGRLFMQKAGNLLDHFSSNYYIDMARRVISDVKGNFESPHVIRLLDIESMRKASLVMQRWVMANPTVRQMYHSQRLDGYYDTYTDVHGKVSKDDHYDYRRVMDGVMQIDEDDWHSTIYIEPLLEGDRDLTHAEKMDILFTWNKMDMILAQMKDDPTSVDGSSL